MPPQSRPTPDVSRRLRSVWTNAPLLGWSLLIVLGWPVLLVLKLRRESKRRKKGRSGKISPELDRLRWTVDPLTPNLLPEALGTEVPHVVFVGQSFGETMLMERLADDLRSRADVRVTLCIRDRATLASVMAVKPGQSVAIWPFDFLVPVSRWLGTYQPDVVVFTERFRFHTFAVAAHVFGAKVAVINGRCRARESAFYALARAHYRWFFGAFQGLYMQDIESRDAAATFAQPGAEVRATGNVKLGLPVPSLEASQAESLTQWLGQRGDVPLLAAGSTGNREEHLMVLEAFRAVRKDIDCRLLWAPRGEARRNELIEILEKERVEFSRRSEGQPDADVYLLDTMGELAYAYGQCRAAYVGGAYRGDGHNVVEPLQWGVPVSYGMNRGYFGAMQMLCEEAEASVRIRGSEDLAEHWRTMLRNPGLAAEMGARGKAMLDEQRGAFRATADALLGLVEDRRP